MPREADAPVSAPKRTLLSSGSLTRVRDAVNVGRVPYTAENGRLLSVKEYHAVQLLAYYTVRSARVCVQDGMKTALGNMPHLKRRYI